MFSICSLVKTKVFAALLNVFKLEFSFIDLSMTTLKGCLPFHSLAVRDGLSNSTVLVPTKIAASSVLHLCTLFLDSGLVIQKGFPFS